MEPSNRRAHLVEIDGLASTFIDGFATAVSAPSYLMKDVGVTWRSEAALD